MTLLKQNQKITDTQLLCVESQKGALLPGAKVSNINKKRDTDSLPSSNCLSPKKSQ